ncbi:AI-2E family transporter [Thioalkalivibrio sp. ALE11]|uniref:AI-2E family transporter n=1 Tax=Thioalkalivibrio sp. ALE11 TaxID=1265494 RepID=UPI00035DF789|nr:AI-2E family transporter [Thioalkalivibrio sp. ALE11]
MSAAGTPPPGDPTPGNVSAATVAALLGLLVVAGALYLLAPILMPFLVALLVGYLFNPLVTRLGVRLNTSRTVATLVIFLLLMLLLAAVVLVLIPLVAAQLERLFLFLPEIMAWFDQQARPWLERHVGDGIPALDPQAVQDMVARHWQEAGGLAGGALHWIGSSTTALVMGVLNLVLIPVVSFYLLRDWPRLIDGLHDLLPLGWRPPVETFARESDEVLGAFLRGQLLVMVSLGLFYAVALSLVGVELGLAIGVIAGVVSFIPYVGVIVGISLASAAVLFAGDGWLLLLVVWAIFAVAQVLESVWLTPWLVGDRTGLHPVAVIFAVLAGGQLFGFVGVLLALPVAAVLAVAVRHALAHYRALNQPAPGGDADP